MSKRYSKRSHAQIHWTRVGYNSVLQGLTYEQVATKDAKVNTWITEGRVKAQRKRVKKVLDPVSMTADQLFGLEERHTATVGPSCAVIMASELDPNDLRPQRYVKRQFAPIAKEQGQAILAMANQVPPAPAGGWTTQEILAVIERLNHVVKECPVCQSQAFLKTYDMMTYAIECNNPDCRLKVERGIVNERGPRQCMQLVLSAWNRRPPYGVQIANLVNAAQEANDWLSETTPGTDQHNRSKKLAKALKPFTR